MSKQPDDFERMMQGALGAEAARFDALLSGPVLEPLYPGTAELIEHFEIFEQQMRNARTDAERDHFMSVFFTQLARINELEEAMPMQVHGVRSYIVGTSQNDLHYGLFESTAQATGRLMGFTFDAWHNVPEGREMPADDDYTFYEEYGLYLCLEDARLTSAALEVECSGMITQIPLQHGAPELFRVHNAE